MLRQGYAEPFFRSRVTTNDPLVPNKNVLLIADADEFRLDAVQHVRHPRWRRCSSSGRRASRSTSTSSTSFNNATVLGKQYDCASPGRRYNNVLEIMNPRIARLGARFFF